MSKPVVGISTYRETAKWGVWDCAADVLHASYADTVRVAGAVPVLLPPASADPASAIAVIDRLDGLIIAGGADVQPTLYDTHVHPKTRDWRPVRDAWEFALLDAAHRRDLPLLGICRGMQLMAVASGGTLHQHVPELLGHTGHGPAPGEFGLNKLRVKPKSRVAEAVAVGVEVACHHHQSVATTPGYTEVAWTNDGSIEAIEAPGPRFCVGVQWHPEASMDHGIVRAFVAAAAQHQAESG